MTNIIDRTPTGTLSLSIDVRIIRVVPCERSVQRAADHVLRYEAFEIALPSLVKRLSSCYRTHECPFSHCFEPPLIFAPAPLSHSCLLSDGRIFTLWTQEEEKKTIWWLLSSWSNLAPTASGLFIHSTNHCVKILR